MGVNVESQADRTVAQHLLDHLRVRSLCQVEGRGRVAKYRKQAFVCSVEEDEEGKRTYVVDGKAFTSPSAAGSHVMGGTACNGWRFWSVEGEDPAANEKPAQPKANSTKAKKPAKLITKTPNQKGVAEGETRFFCNACMKSFLATSEPEACPEGHRADDAELTAAVEA
jgi:hypothetical protein